MSVNYLYATLRKKKLFERAFVMSPDPNSEVITVAYDDESGHIAYAIKNPEDKNHSRELARQHVAERLGIAKEAGLPADRPYGPSFGWSTLRKVLVRFGWEEKASIDTRVMAFVHHAKRLEKRRLEGASLQHE